MTEVEGSIGDIKTKEELVKKSEGWGKLEASETYEDM